MALAQSEVGGYVSMSPTKHLSYIWENPAVVKKSPNETTSAKPTIKLECKERYANVITIQQVHTHNEG